MRRLASLLVVVALVSAGGQALGKTTPLPGAVELPSDRSLLLPFPAGHPVRILSGYGTSMGSSLHDGLSNSGSANDYYALDLVYDAEPNAGKGLPIVASLAGELVKAGWATDGWANYGLRVILRHDLGDGHVYHSIYCHLDAIDPALVEGAMVTQGQLIGALGQSCQGELSCDAFSTPHLHWALHRDSVIGGSGTGGSHGGNAVVPEPLDGAEDLLQGLVVSSTNAGTPVCGDAACSSGEDHASCAEDCPACTLLPAAGGVVDESQKPCFIAGGTPDYWHAEAAGFERTLLWTFATDASRPDNHGIWKLAFQQAGDYQVEVYTDGAFAESKMATYQLTHATTTDQVFVDQTAIDGWKSLGIFAFDAGGDQSIRLDDNTGEGLADDQRLLFDAVRLTSTSEGGAGSSGTGGSTSGGAAPAAAPAGSGEGCGCRLAACPPPIRLGWLLVAALALAARRRPRRR
jgi:hypothetical protein